jgi:transglutaminase-like putative cysteine protease
MSETSTLAMIYLIRHVTGFRYEPEVGESVMEVRLQPRSNTQQRCLTFSLDVNPRATVSVHRDFYGNAVHHFDIPGRHSAIDVIAEATVETLPPRDLEAIQHSTWDELDENVAAGDYWEMLLPSHFAQPTELLEQLRQELNLKREGSPFELLKNLNTSLYNLFDYAPNSTRVDSPIDEALRARCGVCQDFAHIMITLVRQLQIPCRYVSGYLYHGAKSHDRSTAGATHAWVEAYLGEVGWVEFDPTNDLLSCERHIRVAEGRDYSDVPPTRGVHKGKPETELIVSVTVSPIDAPRPEELGPVTVMRSTRSSPSTTDSTIQQQQHQQQ